MCQALENLTAVLVLSLYRHLTPTLPFESHRLHFARSSLMSWFLPSYFSSLFFPSSRLCRLWAFMSLCLTGVREHKGNAGLQKNKRRGQKDKEAAQCQILLVVICHVTGAVRPSEMVKQWSRTDGCSGEAAAGSYPHFSFPWSCYISSCKMI